VLIFEGTRRECAEAALVLEAKDIAYEMHYEAGTFEVRVEPGAAAVAREELARYQSERATRGEPPRIETVAGAGVGACVYAAVLLIVAYCAGAQLLGLDWLAAGALEPAPARQIELWRAVTALTLHLDQLHLLGNLLFGIGTGILAGRLFGPGIAWLGIVLAASAANALEMLISPPALRAVGASTAVFAALGMLSGFAWRLRSSVRARTAYRLGPLAAGIGLLALLGAGDQHVDVLGHPLGFAAGTLAGALGGGLVRAFSASRPVQLASGGLALLLVALAWGIALARALRGA
jgi:membrane associated rhomboid family serine protease